MTKRRYPESSSVSRAPRPRRTRPVPNHYAAAQPPGHMGEHPVDIEIDHLPEFVSRRRKLSHLRQAVQKHARDAHAFIEYEDARTEYTILREQAYFNAGVERGLIAGRAESRAASTDPEVRSFAHQVGLAAASTSIPLERTAAALLDVARAVVLGLPMH